MRNSVLGRLRGRIETLRRRMPRMQFTDEELTLFDAGFRLTPWRNIITAYELAKPPGSALNHMELGKREFERLETLYPTRQLPLWQKCVDPRKVKGILDFHHAQYVAWLGGEPEDVLRIHHGRYWLKRKENDNGRNRHGNDVRLRQ